LKVTFTVSGADAIIGDDSVKVTTKIEQLGLISKEQVDTLFQGAKVFRAAQGNAYGDCVLLIRKSHADRTTAAAYFKGELTQLNQTGSLALAIDGTNLTMNPAILRGVIAAEWNGLELFIRYTFGITNVA
jgi:hypothetical protein